MSTSKELAAIFKEIDKDGDGFISYGDLESSPYLKEMFGNDPNVNMAFAVVQNKMGQNDFALLASAHKLQLGDFAVAKFEASKNISKYLSVSAPGEAAPSLKQSYVKLTAKSGKQAAAEKPHSIEVQVGIDKSHQTNKIQELTQALGHPPHQVFFLIKFKTNKNGEKVAQTLDSIIKDVIELVSGMIPGFENIIEMLKIYARYSNGYTYLVLEVDNPFVDQLIAFVNQVIEAISPQCAFNIRARIASHVKNLLKESFDYNTASGEIQVELDIDSFTMKKFKEIMADNVDIGSIKEPPVLMSLLFEEFKMEAEFDNLGQAVESVFQMNLNHFPKPSQFAGATKDLSLKEKIGQYTESGAELLDLLRESCEGVGEISLNLHDFFAKLSFDVTIDDAFDLL